MIRQALHSHNEDDSGDDADPGCCKKWCKCLFLAILIWLVILKYSDTIRFTPPSPDLSCHASVTWDDMPETINVEKDVWISVEGHVSSGSVIVHSMADSGQEGSIQTQIHVTPSLVEELSYELHDGRQTQLTIRLPQQGDHCVQVDMEIYLPDKAEQLRLSINNVPIKVMDPQSHMDLTDLRTTNAPIDLSNAWEGKRLTLQTANADIHMSSGDIEARDTVHLETANGAIHAANILSKHYIDLINANGVVQADLLQGDDRVHVETTNAEVRIDKVSSDKASIISSNGWIQVNHAVAQDSLVAKTSNAPIDIHVEQVKNGHTQLTTGNSPVTVHMTREYEGSITFTTSKDNAVNVHDAPENFDYDRNESYEKRGMRLSGNGELSVMTTNADADIFFDI
ncbi:hypothetical protein BDB00DRAFT_343435 [Zychaea mexicana]|uniref:uncharacterized protein n=1 Tax=Zychaea mexicana TaxID=64656 RepID=UPI0022FE96B7|nr:uncharacterized protein BDB00DRAFT_343435 [Zychaea mexicana]KAI9494034.1 hypothetical protein BDB00DRAFT_343435 [Zychaea mexicana]